MATNLTGLSLYALTKALRSGMEPLQRGHCFSKKYRTTTFPAKSERWYELPSVDGPSGKSGAGVPSWIFPWAEIGPARAVAQRASKPHCNARRMRASPWARDRDDE